MDTTHLSIQLGALASAVATWAEVAVPNFVGAMVLLVGGWWLAGRAERAVCRVLDRQTRIDPTLRGVLGSLLGGRR